VYQCLGEVQGRQMASRINKPEATFRGLSGFGIAKKSRPDRKSSSEVCQHCISMSSNAVRGSEPPSKNTGPCLIWKTLLNRSAPCTSSSCAYTANMDRHSSPSQGTPAPYGHACASCAQSKCKCIIRRAGGPCERSVIRPKS
jgi:hypothetical protein